MKYTACCSRGSRCSASGSPPCRSARDRSPQRCSAILPPLSAPLPRRHAPKSLHMVMLSGRRYIMRYTSCRLGCYRCSRKASPPHRSARVRCRQLLQLPFPLQVTPLCEVLRPKIARHGHAVRCGRRMRLCIRLLTQLLSSLPEGLASTSVGSACCLQSLLLCCRRSATLADPTAGLLSLVTCRFSIIVAVARWAGLHIVRLGHRVRRRVHQRDARQQRRRRADRQDQQFGQLKENVIPPVAAAQPPPGSASAQMEGNSSLSRAMRLMAAHAGIASVTGPPRWHERQQSRECTLWASTAQWRSRWPELAAT